MALEDIQEIPNPGQDQNWLTDWRNWKKVKTFGLTAIKGTISANQIAYGTATGTIGGSANLTFNGNQLSVGDPAIGGIVAIAGKTGVSNTYSLDTGAASGTLQVSINSASDRFVSLLNAGAGILSLLLDGNIYLSQTEASILGTTVDEADNQRFTFSPGGASGSGRGARIQLAGNEHSDTGTVSINPGNVAGGLVDIMVNDNQAAALKLREGANVYLSLDTTNGSERINALKLIAATDDLKLTTVGKGHYIKQGTNATFGVATLVGGTVTISTTKITANTGIFLGVGSGTLTNIGTYKETARTAGTSFVITSTNILDASTFAWWLLEPA